MLSKHLFVLQFAICLAVLTSATGTCAAQAETVLYNFHGANGALPFAGLIQDSAGNLYGTTFWGGKYGFGTIFEISPSGTQTVIYSFTGGSDSGHPQAALITDGAGNFYGTTKGTGASNFGTVFKVSAKGAQTVIYTFTGKTDGGNPIGALVRDHAGNLYGTTFGGGDASCQGSATSGCGVVFKIAPTGEETLLHTFEGTEGANPYAGLISDEKGNFYGTAIGGGAYYDGTVFKVATSGETTVLHNFNWLVNGDGASPQGSLVRDSAGNLYGTTYDGGNPAACMGFGCGTLFKIDSAGNETILYEFKGQPVGDGAGPLAGLVIDSAGNLYGTTYAGGDESVGVVFKVDAVGTETVLLSFNGSNGAHPWSANLMLDSAGNIYGTTTVGGNGNPEGTVFRIKL